MIAFGFCGEKGWPLAALIVVLLCSGWVMAAPAQESAKPSTSAAPPPVVPLPGPGSLVVSCDPGGCWDEFGVRYDRADPGVFVRVDGKSCVMSKGRMHCE